MSERRALVRGAEFISLGHFTLEILHIAGKIGRENFSSTVVIFFVTLSIFIKIYAPIHENTLTH